MKIDTFLTKEMCPIVEYRNGEQAIKWISVILLKPTLIE